MNHRDVLLKYFKNPEKVIDLIYAGGGTRPNSYGYITSGYGGGVEQSDFIQLHHYDGYLIGLMHGNKKEGLNLLKALNIGLKKKYGLLDDDLPFHDLHEADIFEDE